jgi:hypothetical protein
VGNRARSSVGRRKCLARGPLTPPTPLLQGEWGEGTRTLFREEPRQIEDGDGSRKWTFFCRRVNFTRRVKKSYPARLVRIFWNRETLLAGHQILSPAPTWSSEK